MMSDIPLYEYPLFYSPVDDYLSCFPVWVYHEQDCDEDSWTHIFGNMFSLIK